MNKIILIFMLSFTLGYYTSLYINKNIYYEQGFHRGVQCRSLLSTPSCELLLEKTR